MTALALLLLASLAITLCLCCAAHLKRDDF